ncbi:hypothetical protein [Allocoleopsis sp.]|uniref:hypothetical protein n=1 Tax=Allocoleopsis sp. TaxID=3088169 RepID=UPI002FD5FF1B
MSHFKLKSLVFYGITIGAVVVLFNVVTAYGKANLKAPPKITGRYRISAQNLPDCLKSDTLLLNLEQSGIYLNASLLPAQSNTHLETLAAEKPSLNGELSYPKLSLSGPIPFVSNCKNLAQQADAAGHPLSVNIQGVVQGKTLTGQISLNSTATTAEFIAELEEPKEKPQE